MLQTFLLFLALNIIIITVDITISKLVLLFLVTISTLLIYKWYNKTQQNDKLIIDPFKEIESLVCIELFAKFISLLFLPNQKKKDYSLFLSIILASIFIANQLSMRTLCLLIVDIVAILQLRQNYIEGKHKQMKTTLKIKKTNSFEYQSKNTTQPKAFIRTNEINGRSAYKK